MATVVFENATRVYPGSSSPAVNKLNLEIKDGEFQTACSNACTTGALAFGDVNNEEEDVVALAADKRAYHVLDYLQTKPNVVYQVKVRNTNEA